MLKVIFGLGLIASVLGSEGVSAADEKAVNTDRMEDAIIQPQDKVDIG
ncbi:hypothetical protein ACE1TF_12305 [Geomicrobium sp. JSM 1781026]